MNELLQDDRSSGYRSSSSPSIHSEENLYENRTVLAGSLEDLGGSQVANSSFILSLNRMIHP
jgi:hypothetical protein